MAPSNTLVILRRRGVSDFSNFREKIVIARAPSRIRTNSETRVGSFRPIKNMESELRPDSFENVEIAIFGGYHNLAFPRDHFWDFF